MYKTSVTFCRLILLSAVLTLSGCATLSGEGSLPLPSPSTKASIDKYKESPAKANTKETSGVDVSYSLAQDQFTLHEPVNLTFIVKNELTQPIKLDLGENRKGNFILTIKQPEGKSVRLRLPERGGTSRISRVSLEPGQTYTQNLLLNEWYEFLTLGNYELTISIATTIQTQEGLSIGEISGFHTTLEIKPKDSAHLKQISARLAERVANSPSYDEAAEAALALSYIRDSAAVPYMEKAIVSGHMVEQIVIAGLERLGDEKAIQALIALSTNQDREIAILARRALKRVQQRSKRDDISGST